MLLPTNPKKLIACIISAFAAAATMLSVQAEPSQVGGIKFQLLSVQAEPSQTRGIKFQCRMTSSGIPATMFNTSKGWSPLILWETKEFGEVFTPKNRCDIVTQRFQSAYEKGQYNLTVGQKNGSNIICAAVRPGSSCEDMLLTLKSGMNPEYELKNLSWRFDGLSSSVMLNARPIYSEYPSYTDGFNGQNRPYYNLSELYRLLND